MARPVLLAAAVLATAACNGNRADKQDAIAGIKAADAALSEAVAKKDLEGIVSFYAEDAVLMPTAEPIVTGKAAIRQEWRHVLGIPGMQNVSATKQVDASGCGDMGYTRGTYTSRMVGANGAVVREPGKWVSVWKKQDDGTWRIVVDTFNTDIMPPVHAASTAETH